MRKETIKIKEAKSQLETEIFEQKFFKSIGLSYSRTDTLQQGQELKHGTQIVLSLWDIQIRLLPTTSNYSYLEIW